MGITDLMNPSKIYELLKKGGTIEAQEEIMKYRELLLEQSEEIRNVKKKISELEKQQVIEHELIFYQGLYYREIKDSGREGPYCQKCWDVDKKLVRLQRTRDPALYHCGNCSCSYDISYWQ